MYYLVTQKEPECPDQANKLSCQQDIQTQKFKTSF